jgi:hypothetical protein
MGKYNERITSRKLSKKTYSIFDVVREERAFMALILSLVVISAILAPHPHLAMWFGFGIAAYSAIANDSIQTIGTFIASNRERKWWYLWLYMGLIFVATVSYSWIVYDGDVSHQRLASKGFSEAPSAFSFLQLAAPIILLVLTRFRMPVSTTFLLLSTFSTSADSIKGVLGKSLIGYFIAFGIAMLVWFSIAKFVRKRLKGKPAKWWLPAQWITSGALWSVWIAQDAANIAVYLPRSLSPAQFAAFTIFIFLGLGLLFYLKGDRIQSIVNEKAGVTDIRAATMVDIVYTILLFYFKQMSTIPMSTTWVFIGLLGGRELAISITKSRKKNRRKSTRRALRMIGKDMLYALIGLLVALILSLAINEEVRNELFDF